MTGIDHDRVNAGCLDRSRHRRRKNAARGRSRGLAQVDDDADRIFESIRVADDVGGGELDDEIVAAERRVRDVRIFVRLIVVRSVNRSLEVNRVRLLLFQDRVVDRRAQRDHDLRRPLHVGNGELHVRDSVLLRLDRQYPRVRVPRHFHVRGATEKAGEELRADVRFAVDDDRRQRHFDQIVAHDGEPTVGTESSDDVVERHLEPVTVGRHRSAERGDYIGRRKERHQILMKNRNRFIARGQTKRGLRGLLRENDRRCGEDDDNGEEEDSLHTRRVARIIAGDTLEARHES